MDQRRVGQIVVQGDVEVIARIHGQARSAVPLHEAVDARGPAVDIDAARHGFEHGRYHARRGRLLRQSGQAKEGVGGNAGKAGYCGGQKIAAVHGHLSFYVDWEYEATHALASSRDLRGWRSIAPDADRLPEGSPRQIKPRAWGDP